MEFTHEFSSFMIVSKIFILLFLSLQEDRDIGVETLQLPGLHLVLETIEAILEISLGGGLEDPDPLLVDGLLLVLDHRVPSNLLLVSGYLKLLFVNPS